ncbi:MAG: phosphatase PAP2 family protein [Microcella sp.]|uniref:phosphatase PAP2 family protein n=1 Tax=Microcella sp. TaxID=1913979 RepID=UPI00331549AB
MSSPARRRVVRHWPILSGGIAVGVAALLGVILAVREGPLEVDEEWMSEVLEERGPWWDIPALLMNWLGGGIVGVVVVPLAIVLALFVVRRPVGAAVFLLASAVSAVLVQVIKSAVGRARPEEMLVVSDVGSFPSGHVANAATMAVTLALILALQRDRWWFWMLGAGYVLAMALSRTYLGVHWLSDTIGGALLGAGIAVVLWVPFARRLAEEPRVRRAARAEHPL